MNILTNKMPVLMSLNVPGKVNSISVDATVPNDPLASEQRVGNATQYTINANCYINDKVQSYFVTRETFDKPKQNSTACSSSSFK